MNTVTAAQMKQIEKNAFLQGMPYLEMMENAGTAAYRLVCERFPRSHMLTIAVGKGNNGGDGFVIARLAAQEGRTVQVILTEGIPVTEDALENYHRLLEIKHTGGKMVSIVSIDEADAFLPVESDASQILIDAVYGTGFHGELRENGAAVCRLFNESHAFTVALDVPSGINADTGEAAEGAIRANLTVVFDSYKRLHEMDSCRSFCGEIVLVDIGIPQECHLL